MNTEIAAYFYGDIVAKLSEGAGCVCYKPVTDHQTGKVNVST